MPEAEKKIKTILKRQEKKDNNNNGKGVLRYTTSGVVQINSDTFIQMLFLVNVTMHQKLEISWRIVFFISQPVPLLDIARAKL